MLTSSKAVSSTVAPAVCLEAGLGKPWSASNANKPAALWLPKQDPKNQPQTWRRERDLDCTRSKAGRRERKSMHSLLMQVRRKSAGSSKILRWLTPLLGPNLDPKTGPKQRPKRRNENVIQFWTHFGVHIWSHRRILPLSAYVVQADLQPCSLNYECQLIPFSPCASQVRLLLYDEVQLFCDWQLGHIVRALHKPQNF